MPWKRLLSARLGFVAAAFVAAACSESSDSVGVGRSLAPPQFSFSPNGITLDQANSGLPQSGRRFVKGFNPTNPHNGDAIVVTAFWLGSTNIVDSVTDHLVDANFTEVGNAYHLIEYVTAGGISMATFVATGVQHIPPANPDGTNVLAIEVALHDSVSDGGIMMSAYSGVEDVFTTALGAHSSASGSASAPVPAHPGTLTTTTPGALVYGVTMSRPPVGFDPPPGYNADLAMNGLSDATIKADGRYAVQANPTSTDPTWTWYYDSAHAGTWLASGLVLIAASGTSTTGNLTATTSTSGSNLDPDGYAVAVDGGAPQAIGINGSVTFNTLPAGSHTVTLSGVASNCSVTSANPQTVSVPSGGTATAAFSVTCSSTTGNLTVSASTSGSSLDPDGYTATVDGGSPQALAINGSVSYTNLSAGNHTVAISGVAGNCTVSGGTSQTVSVPSGGTATTTFTVTCTTPAGNLTVSASTSGSGLDPDGYTVTVDGGSARALAINGSVSYTNLTPGNHTVAISGVASNCTVSGGTSRTVSVPSGGTATTTFSVSCTAPNSAPVVNAGPDGTAITGLLYSISPSFSDANNDGPWSYRIDWGDGSVSTGTRTSQGSFTVGHSYVIIFPRSFTIRVTVTDAHGASGSDTKVVQVVLL